MKNFFKKLFCSNSMSKHFSETVQRIGKNNAGFSLVELIVVIAIMAILAAVAVVGVSVYIPKAQKAADEQMIADVQKAVDLYSGMEDMKNYAGKSGYIVIHRDGNGTTSGNVSIASNDANFAKLLTDAIEATYGSKYGTELKVSYQEWVGVLSDAEVENISSSSYIANTDDLLSKIQILTNSVEDFGSTTEEANRTTLDVANATSMMTAEQKAAFIQWWCGGFDPYTTGMLIPGTGLDLVASMAAYYARLESLVLFCESRGCIDKSDTEKGVNTEFTEASENISIISNDQSVTAAINNVYDKLVEHMGGCPTCQTAFAEYSGNGTQAQVDANAYIALLRQVDDMSGELEENADITSRDFYNSDYIKNTINGYASSVNAYSETQAKSGDIIVVVMVNSDGSITYKVYPLDY